MLAQSFMSIYAFINKCVKTAPVLTEAEERELLRLYQTKNDLDSREKIIESQVAMVAAMAQRFARTHRKNEFMDLFQIGMLGLLQATDKFDLTLMTRFSNYAQQWVMREMQIAVRKNLRIAYVPITTQREKIFTETVKQRKNAEDINELIELIHDETGVAKGMVKEMITAMMTTDISLNTKISAAKHNILPEDNSELQDILPSKSPNPEEEYEQQEVNRMIMATLASLKEVEEQVILGKYFAEKSNDELSREVGRGVVSMLNLELKTRKKLMKKLKELKHHSWHNPEDG